jgi:hypothetical protein
LGLLPNIIFFPKQGIWLNKKVMVYLKYAGEEPIAGTFIRDDMEYPSLRMIKLKDSRTILSGECQYEFLDD